MIYEALIVPHERPVTAREIKRALITYDRVVLIDPSDRDLIPPNALPAAMFGMPMFGFSTGPVRPLGKTPHYDDEFQQAVEECEPAREQGLLVVESTYRQEETQGFSIGGVPTGGYPLHPRFVYWLYRSMAGDPGFLSDALGDDVSSLLDDPTSRTDLALAGGGDGSINDVPALPLAEIDGVDDDLRLAATQVARSRLAGIIKCAGYCEAKQLVPIFDNQVFGPIAARLVNNCAKLLASGEDPFWHAASRVLQLCHEEYLVDKRLDELSTKQILALRSQAWGKQATAREALFQAVLFLSRTAKSDDAFLVGVADQLREYRTTASVVVRERANLGLRIKCELGAGVLTAAAGIEGLASLLASPLPGIGLTLAAGGIWALSKTKEYVPQLRELRAQEKEIERGPGLGLHNFYSRLGADG